MILSLQLSGANWAENNYDEATKVLLLLLDCDKENAFLGPQRESNP